MALEKKLSEGLECMKNAEKFMKTSLMKWRPNYDSAAHEYSKAATCFRTAKAFDHCKDAHLKAANCYAQNQSYFSAAKSYEQAALICKEMENFSEAVKMVEKACQLFREHGTPDTAALALEKGAKMVEAKLPEAAINLYTRATDVVMIEGRPAQAAEYAGKAARLLTKLKRYDEAADMLRKELQYQVTGENTRATGRVVIAQVLIHLIREDYVAADKAFKEGGSFLENEECSTLSQLLEGYDQGDAEMLNRALNHPFIKHMDVEYARLARTLQSAGITSCGGLDSYAEPSTSVASSSQGGEKEDISELL